MSDNLERRYRRTEAQLQEALVALLAGQSYRQITVRALTDRADLNRSTFYLHYADIPDFLRQTEQRLLEALEVAIHAMPQSSDTTSSWLLRQLQAIVHILAEHRDLYLALTNPNGDPDFVQAVNVLFYRFGLAAFQQTAGANPLPQPELDYILSFLQSGCTGLIQRWLVAGCPESPTYIARMAWALVQRGAAITRRRPTQG